MEEDIPKKVKTRSNKNDNNKEKIPEISYKNIDLKNILENYEKEIISHTFFKTKRNQTKTAKLLKMKGSTLQYKLKKYELLD